MQFDLKKFFATGKQPYHAEFQCDLSGRDFAGAQIPQPVTVYFDAQIDGSEVWLNLRQRRWYTASAPAVLILLCRKRRWRRSGQ